MPPMRVKDGEVYGYWTIMDARPKASLCSCRCGVTGLVQNQYLTGAKEPKCAKCQNKRQAASRKGIIRTVRKYDSSLPPDVYRRMRRTAFLAIHRCTNPLYAQWKDYGGRGIKVYQEWMDDPTKFINYLGSLPGADNPDLWIDRINNDGDYEPGNLRFVTSLVSNHNRRTPTLK